mgnify:FL=1
MAYDAEVVLSSVRGERSVPLESYYTGYRASVKAPDELITAIVIPHRARTRHHYEKVGSRAAQAITKVGFALVRDEQSRHRVCANSVAATVRRCPAVEAVFDSDDVTLHNLRVAVAQDVDPIDDLRSTRAYRHEVLARTLAALG